MLKPKVLIAIAVVILLGVFFGGAYVYRQSQSKEMADRATQESASLVREYSPSIGSSLLRVTVVEFLDPECESCRDFHPVMKEILKRYDGQVRYVIRYAPFHGNSRFVVKMLEAVRLQGKYWEALDVFFEKQPEWGDHHNPNAELLWTYLPSLGVDVEKVRADMENSEIAKNLEQDIADGARLGIRGTPTFFVNGQPLQHFGPEFLIEAIEAEL